MASRPMMQELKISCDAAAVPRARSFLAGMIEAAGIDEDAAFDLLLAFDEAASNACQHGKPKERRGHIAIRWSVGDARAAIQVADNGHGFDPETLDVTRPPDPLSPGGRGLYLMHQLMDDVTIDSSPRGTVVMMEKHVPAFGRPIRRSA